eukprot:c29362_g1_i2 orf=1188-1409(-)
MPHHQRCIILASAWICPLDAQISTNDNLSYTKITWKLCVHAKEVNKHDQHCSLCSSTTSTLANKSPAPSKQLS